MAYMTDFTGSLSYDSVTVDYIPSRDLLKMSFPNYYEGRVVWIDNKENFWVRYSYYMVSSSFDSILIAGLGIGAMPYWVNANTTCSIIDVVEFNEDVISACNDIGHLDSSINVIQDDILTYIPSRNYDLIVLDTWWDGVPCQDEIDTEKPQLITKYQEYLNEDGALFIPIDGTVVEKE